MDKLKERGRKVFEFMDEVNKEHQKEIEQEAFKNTEVYKKRYLDKEMNDAKDTCLNYIFADVYKNSLPLDPDYKALHKDELEDDIKDFINKRTADKGVTVYVKEAIKRGNPAMKKLMESVENFVNASYFEKATKIKTLTTEDLDFHFGDDEKKKMDEISRDLELDDISKIIQNNVKRTTEMEIERSKQEKEEEESLQNSLAEDDSITEESAIDTVIAFKNAKREKVYEPSLFESIMISKFNNCVTESTEDQYEVFCEAVREFTKHNVVKALKLETYTPAIIKKISNEYASK